MRKPLSDMGRSLLNHLSHQKIKPGPCSPEIREWWEKEALKPLLDQALSELRRNDGFPPRLLGFMNDGTMGVIDIAKATHGLWGDVRSKDAAATTHQISARIPGVKASVFMVEAWALRANDKGEMDRQLDKYPDLGDHPDATEAVMLNMLHYDEPTGVMMQLQTIAEVIKVLGVNRSRKAWADTKYGSISNTDPNNVKPGEPVSRGRFIFGREGDDDVE